MPKKHLEENTPDPDEKTYFRKLYVHVQPGEVYAFIPGTIVKIFVKEGVEIQRGQPLLSLHAMKMNNNICAPINGTIESINIKEGDKVSKNDVLIKIIPS